MRAGSSAPNAAAATPDVQCHIMLFSGDTIAPPLHPFSGISCPLIVLRPESRGTVRVKSGDPTQAPAIQPHYLGASKDRDAMVAGLRALRGILAAPALAPFVEAEHDPGPACASDADLLDFARRKGSTVYHPTSTCRMGDDPSAVVDARLRVRGVKALRIVDAFGDAGAGVRQHECGDDHDRREGVRIWFWEDSRS